MMTAVVARREWLPDDRRDFVFVVVNAIMHDFVDS